MVQGRCCGGQPGQHPATTAIFPQIGSLPERCLMKSMPDAPDRGDRKSSTRDRAFSEIFRLLWLRVLRHEAPDGIAYRHGISLFGNRRWWGDVATQPGAHESINATRPYINWFMAYLVILGSVGLLLALAAFFWSRYGPGSGRAFGNKIAKHNGIPRNTFWYLLDNGAKGSALDILMGLEKSAADLEQASVELGPTLQRGMERLEARFGPQSIYEVAKPIISRLVASSEKNANPVVKTDAAP